MNHLNEDIQLSKREQEVIFHLSAGMLNKEIAAELNISIDTVKKHIKAIFRKLNVRNRAGAVHWFCNKNVIENSS